MEDEGKGEGRFKLERGTSGGKEQMPAKLCRRFVKEACNLRAYLL